MNIINPSLVVLLFLLEVVGTGVVGLGCVGLGVLGPLLLSSLMEMTSTSGSSLLLFFTSVVQALLDEQSCTIAHVTIHFEDIFLVLASLVQLELPLCLHSLETKLFLIFPMGVLAFYLFFSQPVPC